MRNLTAVVIDLDNFHVPSLIQKSRQIVTIFASAHFLYFALITSCKVQAARDPRHICAYKCACCRKQWIKSTQTIAFCTMSRSEGLTLKFI